MYFHIKNTFQITNQKCINVFWNSNFEKLWWGLWVL